MGKIKYDIDDFGILKWNVEDPSLSVDFLDLTLTIEDGNIVSKTYQKPLNLGIPLHMSKCSTPAMDVERNCF